MEFTQAIPIRCDCFLPTVIFQHSRLGWDAGCSTSKESHGSRPTTCGISSKVHRGYTVTKLSIEDLKQQKRWVCWKLTKIPGRDKPTKVPYTPGGRKAACDDANTWSTYAECMAVVS